jgi:hypothetical protein
VVAPCGWFFFSKKGRSDQSVRNSARVINQPVSLYSPVSVYSFTVCASPVESPFLSSKNSRRAATAAFLPMA